MPGCLPGTGACVNNNFEIYYCRDAGKVGTADDIPAVLSGSTVIRGESTITNTLKELFFFREATPAQTASFAVTD